MTEWQKMSPKSIKSFTEWIIRIYRVGFDKTALPTSCAPAHLFENAPGFFRHQLFILISRKIGKAASAEFRWIVFGTDTVSHVFFPFRFSINKKVKSRDITQIPTLLYRYESCDRMDIIYKELTCVFYFKVN